MLTQFTSLSLTDQLCIVLFAALTIATAYAVVRSFIQVIGGRCHV